jgi:hypothetical protein
LAFLAERVHTPECTRERERARQCGHPSPCRRVAPLRRATSSLTTAQRACRPYHALVLVGRAVDALFACWHFHLSFHRLAGALSNRAHTHARVRDVYAARGTAPPSRLRRPGLCPCRDCVTVLLALAVVAEPPALTRANPTVALHTSSKTKAPRSRPPRRSVSPHLRGRPSDRLGARASGQVSARVRPHARTQANTPACRRGARRRGQATGMPARSSEDMDAVFGRPMLTHACEGQGLTFLWPDLV